MLKQKLSPVKMLANVRQCGENGIRSCMLDVFDPAENCNTVKPQ